MLSLIRNDYCVTDAVKFALGELEKVLSDDKVLQLEVKQDDTIEEQGYHLTVEGDRFQIIGGDEAGVMYGVLDLAKKVEHNGGIKGIQPASVTPYIKSRGIKFNIPLDEYPRRCIEQIKGWEEERNSILKDGKITHDRSKEYASYIMEAVVTNQPYKIGGNVINNGSIENLPADACVEVPCLVDGTGVNPCRVGRLPVQLAAMNMSNINVQLLTIEAAATKKKEYIYQAAMMDPHTGAELSIDDIVKMCDELIDAHGDYMKMYK